MNNLRLRLCLVRHGETEENVARLLQGHMPGTLTANGRQQAEELRKLLCINDFDAIVSSDLKRVTDTVEILLDGRREVEWKTTPLLREIDWGSMTGMKIADVNFKKMAADVETREMLYERAGRAAEWLCENYADKKLLIVSHGLFLRSLTAQLTGVLVDKLHTIERLDNCGMRWIEV